METTTKYKYKWKQNQNTKHKEQKANIAQNNKHTETINNK